MNHLVGNTAVGNVPVIAGVLPNGICIQKLLTPSFRNVTSQKAPYLTTQSLSHRGKMILNSSGLHTKKPMLNEWVHELGSTISGPQNRGHEFRSGRPGASAEFQAQVHEIGSTSSRPRAHVTISGLSAQKLAGSSARRPYNKAFYVRCEL